MTTVASTMLTRVAVAGVRPSKGAALRICSRTPQRKASVCPTKTIVGIGDDSAAGSSGRTAVTTAMTTANARGSPGARNRSIARPTATRPARAD